MKIKITSNDKVKKLDWNDERLQNKIDAALDYAMDYRAKFAPVKKRSEYNIRTAEDEAYDEAIKQIWTSYLEGTGWTEEEVTQKLEQNANGEEPF
jgi:hypothetical protein